MRTIEYTITVDNTGNEPSVGVTVNDTLLGDITGDFDLRFANPFPVGEMATAVVSYTPEAGDPDPITNTVTATGTGADSGVEASDDASCEHRHPEPDHRRGEVLHRAGSRRRHGHLHDHGHQHR